MELRHIPEYAGYVAGDDGSIWTLWRFGGRIAGWLLTPWPQRRLRPQSGTGGHLRVTLAINGVRTHQYGHALVLFAFVGPRPFPGAECRHANDTPTDNRPENLSWGTKRQNSQDRTDRGRVPKGTQNGKSKLTPRQVLAIVRSPLSCRAAAKRYGVKHAAIQSVRCGRTWSHLTGIQRNGSIDPITTARPDRSEAGA